MVNSKKISYFAGTLLFWLIAIFGVLYVPHFFRIFQDPCSINVLLWSGVVDEKIISDFTKQTGIKVNVSYFQSNDELMVKVLATKGSGYDMIMPSDYAVTFFSQNGFLKKIDKTKLHFWDNINPKFLNYEFDPNNEYSIPAEWYVLGIGVNTKHFGNVLPEASWETIFQPSFSPENRIGLLSDNREMACLAVKYLFGELRSITECETEQVKTLLMNQKKWVEAYTDFRGDFLLESGNCSIVLVPVSVIWKMLIKNPSIAFLLPKEGTLLGIENYVILKSSQKEDLVYQFINYLFKLDVQKYNFHNRMSLSTRKDADFIKEIPILKKCLEIVGDTKIQGCAQPFKNVLTNDQVNELCMAVKGI